MSASNFDRWSKLRELGRKKYVFWHGVVGWGVPSAVLFTLLQYYLDGGSFLGHLGLALVLFPLGGIFYGRFMWKMIERQHAKATSNAK